MRIFMRIYMASIEKTISQLENQIIEKQNENVLLRKHIHHLKVEIAKLNGKYQQLMIKSQRFPLTLQSDFHCDATHLSEQTIRILEQKITMGDEQIQQLKNVNSNYQETILNLEGKLLAKQRQEFVYKQEFRNTQKQISILKYNKQLEQKHIEEVLNKWQNSNEQKLRIVMENEKLKRSNQMLKNEANMKISQLLQFNQLLFSFLLGIESLKNDAGTLISETKLQNEKLMHSLREKTDLLNLYLFSSNTVDFMKDKIHDAHTIRCLKQQIAKRGHFMEQVVARIQYIQRITTYLQKYNMIQHQTQNIIQQNQLLKTKLQHLQEKIKTLEDCLHAQNAQNPKIYDLLVENEACHQLLYDIKGSFLYQRDVQQKVDIIMKQLEIRTTMRDRDWTDIRELVQVNRRLRALVPNQEAI